MNDFPQDKFESKDAHCIPVKTGCFGKYQMFKIECRDSFRNYKVVFKVDTRLYIDISDTAHLWVDIKIPKSDNVESFPVHIDPDGKLFVDLDD